MKKTPTKYDVFEKYAEPGPGSTLALNILMNYMPGDLGLGLDLKNHGKTMFCTATRTLVNIAEHLQFGLAPPWLRLAPPGSVL